MTQIIADSTCDLDPTLLGKMKLPILPLCITLNDQTYLDGVEISVDTLYEQMRLGVFPKTSQIPYDSISTVFERCARAGQDFIYIAFSSEMSGCCSLASTIASDLSQAFPDVRMAVVDSRGGSSATGLIVLQALRLAAQDLPFDDLLIQIDFMASHVEHVFSVSDLEWMAKGGRISKPLGYVGSKLHLRPWLDVEQGRMVVKGIVRGERKAIAQVVEEVVKRAAAFPDQLIAISHSDALQAALEVEKEIKALLPRCTTTICHIGSVLGVHIGLNAIGVFCFNQKPPRYVY